MNAASMASTPRPRIRFAELAAEPFRLFFPAGVLAGIMGAALWPLHFLGLMETYPGLVHARLMACGMFGAFIFGFLGTATPRMLSAKPFRAGEATALLVVYACMTTAFALGHVVTGDAFFFALLMLFGACLARRAASREDTPPPGFVLVLLALLCAAVASGLALMQHWRELETFWITLQRLLLYQGFVLFPILGIGPFLLPRFFGMPSAHDFPETRAPGANWGRKAALAGAAGVLILISFVMEARGAYASAYGLRFATTLGYVLFEIPFHRAPGVGNALGASVRIAFAGIVAGFLAVALFPAHRVGLLHLTLVGGFAVITFVVATRVVFGHSGNLSLLQGRNRWLLVAVGLMLLGMATRISGDFWPKILASHYMYGAVLWIAGVLLWAIFVLPKVLIVEKE
jgi:uncharacterized protein involved in response to NO